MKHLSVSYDNGEILTAVSEIFLRGGWYDADVTYGKGAFWKGLQRPGRCSDLHPLFPDVVQDDSTALRTYADGSMGSIVFDPPFLFRSRRAENTETMCRWYGYFRSYAELWDMYSQSLDAIRRVLRPRGFLVMKCQDMTDSRFYCTHAAVIDYAVQNGYVLKDILVKVNRHKLQRDARQQNCAAKVHSYFLVLQKREG